MKKTLNIAVIGYSNIAKKSIIPALVETNYFNLKMIGTRDVGKLTAAFDTEVSICSYDDVINAKDIDCVYVSLPVSLHYEWAVKVLESGKHLLLEKTFTDSYDRAAQLIHLAEERNLICMEALMYTYHPLFNQVSSMIQDGCIGEIRSIEAAFGFPYLNVNDIRNNRELGGGAILDALIYPLSLSLKIANSKDFTYNFEVFNNNDGYNVDTRGFLLIKYSTFTAYMAYGFGFYYRNEYLIWGSEGYIKVNRAFSRPADLEARIYLKNNSGEKDIVIPPANHFINMIEAFYQKINKIDISGDNEKDEILTRMKVISELYEKL